MKCKVGVAVEEIGDSFYQAILESFMEDHKHTSSHSIMRGMREAGFDVGERTIDRHRTNRCVCGGNK
jgi:hypothetical protein